MTREEIFLGASELPPSDFSIALVVGESASEYTVREIVRVGNRVALSTMLQPAKQRGVPTEMVLLYKGSEVTRRAVEGAGWICPDAGDKIDLTYELVS